MQTDGKADFLFFALTYCADKSLWSQELLKLQILFTSWFALWRGDIQEQLCVYSVYA